MLNMSPSSLLPPIVKAEEDEICLYMNTDIHIVSFF